MGHPHDLYIAAGVMGFVCFGAYAYNAYLAAALYRDLKKQPQNQRNQREPYETSI